MTIRRRLQLVYLLILLSTVVIGALAVWSTASWQRASVDLTYSHVQGQRVERVRGDIYRQVKEVVDWLTEEDKDADDEFRHLAALTGAEIAVLERNAQGEEELLALVELRRSYDGLQAFAERVFNDPRTNRAQMPWLEEQIESQLFPELEERIEALRGYYQSEGVRSIQGTEKVQDLARSLTVIIVLLSLVQGGILLFGIQRWLVRPLAEISRSTAVISTGNFRHRVDLRSRDEMGNLAQAINRMAEELRQSQARLVQSERLAALGELVGYIAHNIRNPLASIRAAAQVGRDETPQAGEAFQDVIDTVDRLERWAQDLLSFMKPLGLNLVREDLSRLVRNAVSVLQNRVEDQGTRLVLDLHALPPVETDAQWMEQALAAVVANALEASGPEAVVRVSSHVAGNDAVVQVSDEGPGIQQDIANKIFDPYFTTKAGGVGLGLAMAKKVMTAHRGGISLQSEPGKGTTVTLRCPLAPGRET